MSHGPKPPPPAEPLSPLELAVLELASASTGEQLAEAWSAVLLATPMGGYPGDVGVLFELRDERAVSIERASRHCVELRERLGSCSFGPILMPQDIILGPKKWRKAPAP